MSAPRPTAKSCSEERLVQRRRVLAVVVAALALMPGCTRSFFRRLADCDAYGVLEQAAQDPRWQLKDYTIDPPPASRFYDPHSPDHPPMPPDDPAAHQLMHCVDGKRGWRGWHKDGATPWVENPYWRDYLPVDDEGKLVVDRRGAMRLALLHSPEYQRQLENLYLSALDVTLQRFRFDAQFFGAHSTFFTTDGPARASGAKSELALHRDVDRVLKLQRRLATGGELVVGLANSLVWQFAGPDQYTASSVLDFSLVQPLLRASGRAIVLENLTQSERDLLANVRQMERFRKSFYVEVIAGRGAAAGPARGGPSVAAPAVPSGAAGGMLALMAQRVQIRNQWANVTGLRDSVQAFEAIYPGGRVDRFQVDLARQALYNAESQLLALETSYEDRLDAFKLNLGLPPDLPLQIEDELLAPLDLIDPRLTAVRDEVDGLLRELRESAAPFVPADYVERIRRIRQAGESQLELVGRDFQRLIEALPVRRRQLTELVKRPDFQRGAVDPSAFDVAALHRQVIDISREIEGPEAATQRAAELDVTLGPEAALREQAPVTPPLAERLRQTFNQLDQLAAEASAPDAAQRADQLRAALLPLVMTASEELLELSLIQARARLDAVTLVPVDLEPQLAFDIARQCRLDWMNARAALVDAWRQVKIAADDLRSRLDVTFSGDMGTVGNNPAKFRATTGRLRAGLELDAPLTRLAERNAYREALIAYQQARRNYYTFADRVQQSLRATLRSIRVAQLDFELRRAAVHVAITQVDRTQERLREQRHPKPGQEPQPLGPTAARDLVESLSRLLSAQNDFLRAWVDYEVQRMNLDLDMGTMRLDAEGNWIDPGPIDRESLRGLLPPGAREPLPDSPGAWPGAALDREPDAAPDAGRDAGGELLLPAPLPEEIPPPAGVLMQPVP